MLGPYANYTFDCVLNTSNVPTGGYLRVYDEDCYSVDDFSISTDIIFSLNAMVKASICLDMTFKLIKPGNNLRYGFNQ